MLLLTATLSGCATNQVGRNVDAAAARIGVANAGSERVRQPAECRQDWPLLDRGQIVGREKLVVIDKYEAYITGTINPGKRRCWQFNERIYAGPAAQAGGHQ